MTTITLRFPDQLAQQVRDAATEDHRSMNSEIIALMEAALAARATARTLVNA